MPRLEGKVAVITGGSNGLGRAIATRMAEEGATIAVLDLDAAGEKVVAKLGGSGNESRFLHCDISDEAAVQKALNDVFATFGRIDILVNNAGVEGPNQTTETYPLEDWERVFAANTRGVFLCTKHVVGHMRASGGGSIIDISSIYGILGGGGCCAGYGKKRCSGICTR